MTYYTIQRQDYYLGHLILLLQIGACAKKRVCDTNLYYCLIIVISDYEN